MGMISGVASEVMGTLFGGGRNVVAETVEVFRENAEKGAARETEMAQATLAQFATEFAQSQETVFDRMINGLNRIPRPAMALGTLGLFVSAMVDPIWFASRMQGVALVPEPLWWLLGAIVGFYFGARHQAKGQEFQRSIASTLARAGQVTEGLAALQALDAGSGGAPQRIVAPDSDPGVIDVSPTGPNAALAEWKDAHS